MALKTYVYVDAFNLYFGALKKTPHRWLDLSKLCQHLLPNNDVTRINYYTALVKARPKDPQQPVRQQTYLRALRTDPRIKIHLGHFLTHNIQMPTVTPPPPFVKVIKTEEKGSDVNLASHLIADGFTNQYDIAVVISNDSDLVEPIKIVHETIKKPIGVINPQIRSSHPSKELIAHATFFKQLRHGALAASQFPQSMTDATGVFTKPVDW